LSLVLAAPESAYSLGSHKDGHSDYDNDDAGNDDTCDATTAKTFLFLFFKRRKRNIVKIHCSHCECGVMGQIAWAIHVELNHLTWQRCVIGETSSC